MEFKNNLTNDEENLFSQILLCEIDRLQKIISDIENELYQDYTGNLKKTQDNIKTLVDMLNKYLYCHKFSLEFSCYVSNKKIPLISDKGKYTEDDIYNNIAEFVMMFDTSCYPIMDKDDVIKDVKILWNKLS